MTRRRLTTRLQALERRHGPDPERPPVWWTVVVRSGADGRRDLARDAGAAMRATVREELTRAGWRDRPSITMIVVSDDEGLAEGGGRRWRFALADDGAGGTVATITGREGLESARVTAAWPEAPP